MKIKSLFILCCCYFFTIANGFSQLTVVIEQVPSITPADAELFLGGTVNGWDPGSQDYKFSNDNVVYFITLNTASGNLKFKVTRGSWPTVEGTSTGAFIPDRSYDYAGGVDTLRINVEGWEDLSGGGTNPNSTAAPNVQLLDNDFFMPELNRNRRIWVYLPPDYDQTDNTYPVIYMHDGQNLFDASLAFSGEWKVDETLNAKFNQGDKGAIVIGIENGGGLRISEYAPWSNPQYGGGEGSLYMDFIVNTLKPYVDATYRTKPDRLNTVLFGSSLGAHISMYGIAKYPEIFGKAGLFSPAYWFNSQINFYVTARPYSQPLRLYTIAGLQEDPLIVNGTYSMTNAQAAANYPIEIRYREFHADGQHSEWYWAREFGAAYTWLFNETTDVQERTLPSLTWNLHLDTMTGELSILGNELELEQCTFQWTDTKGQVLKRAATLQEIRTINFLDKTRGMYFITIHGKNGNILGTKKVIW